MNSSSNKAEAMAQLEHEADSHSFWSNSFLKACKKGTLTLEDFRFFFGQYSLYTRSFSRFLTATMTHSENDLHRAWIAENLWEESGESDPEKRHAEIFRRFLTNSLGIEDINAIEYLPSTREFVNGYLQRCLNPDIVYSTAMLSLGTEGIVPRLYQIMIEGMENAGIASEELNFFHLHVECDDDHAISLNRMLASFADSPGWEERARRGMNDALDLRAHFFEVMYEKTERSKVSDLFSDISEGEPVIKSDFEVSIYRPGKDNTLYQNIDPESNTAFHVSRFNLPGQVLDPREVRIPPGKNNEYHQHAHETFIYVLEGEGEMKLEEERFQLTRGHAVLVPRWAYHQMRNTGNDDLVFLGITDFGLTKRFPGNTETSYRHQRRSVPGSNK